MSRGPFDRRGRLFGLVNPLDGVAALLVALIVIPTGAYVSELVHASAGNISIYETRPSTIKAGYAQRITINGSGLKWVREVRVGPRILQPGETSTGQLMVDVPGDLQPGMYTVVVTDRLHRMAILENGVAVVETPPEAHAQVSSLENGVAVVETPPEAHAQVSSKMALIALCSAQLPKELVGKARKEWVERPKHPDRPRMPYLRYTFISGYDGRPLVLLSVYLVANLEFQGDRPVYVFDGRPVFKGSVVDLGGIDAVVVSEPLPLESVEKRLAESKRRR